MVRANDGENRPVKLAACMKSISHFEAPLFKLASTLAGLELRVFYLDPQPNAPRHDGGYGTTITWGSNLLDGYISEHCATAAAMRSAVTAWDADVVLMYGYAWSGAARMILTQWLRRRPQIHRGTLSYVRDPRVTWRSRVIRPARNWLLRRFTAHHYGGEYSRRALLAAGVDAERFFFVPYSVDSTWFAAKADDPALTAVAAAIRSDAGWASDDRVLLLVCQHSWIKGPDIALEVLRQCHVNDSTFRLLVVGLGVMTDYMKTFVTEHELEDSVFFAGFIPSAGTVPYYLAADLVLCTSRFETWGRMINEAMLCRRPCVVNRYVAAADDLVVDDDNGYVVDDLCPRGYVAAIARFFRLSADRRRTLGANAREAACRFSYEENLDAVVHAARYAARMSRK